MGDETEGTPRPDRADRPSPGREPTGSPGGDRRAPSGSWKVDPIHRLGWMAYVLALLLLLGLLLAVGRVLTGWMAGYAETAVTLPEEP
ncbi:hypothetical protein [Tautonia plasticadhaerens]|uniref:Uncharacterized protein n=1 Tax=Tautonia plasticadhaerens TaxID=2527974 RepID=A0A518GVI1_9BACT|nr:hypothetical protein [Tautonia plasticadhaerens]QDV32596.1 hypothetical protein ElP_04310 [Tautonia plasticadhaerens]